jgi:hypothetical protein
LKIEYQTLQAESFTMAKVAKNTAPVDSSDTDAPVAFFGSWTEDTFDFWLTNAGLSPWILAAFYAGQAEKFDFMAATLDLVNRGYGPDARKLRIGGGASTFGTRIQAAKVVGESPLIDLSDPESLLRDGVKEVLANASIGIGYDFREYLGAQEPKEILHALSTLAGMKNNAERAAHVLSFYETRLMSEETALASETGTKAAVQNAKKRLGTIRDTANPGAKKARKEAKEKGEKAPSGRVAGTPETGGNTMVVSLKVAQRLEAVRKEMEVPSASAAIAHLITVWRDAGSPRPPEEESGSTPAERETASKPASKPAS